MPKKKERTASGFLQTDRLLKCEREVVGHHSRGRRLPDCSGDITPGHEKVLCC